MTLNSIKPPNVFFPADITDADVSDRKNEILTTETAFNTNDLLYGSPRNDIELRHVGLSSFKKLDPIVARHKVLKELNPNFKDGDHLIVQNGKHFPRQWPSL